RVREVMGDLASGEEVGNLIEQYRLLMREVLRSPNPWGRSQSEFQGSGIGGGSDPSSALGGGSPDPRDGSPNERDPDGGDPGDGDPGGGGAGGPGGPEGPGRGDSPGQDPERPEYFQQQVEGVRQLLLREGLSDICPEPLVEVEIGGRRYRGGVLEAVALCASRYASGDVLAYRELQAITNSFNAHFDRIINLEKLANREPSAALEEMIHAYDDKLADCLEAGLGRLLGGSGMSLLGSLKGRTIEARRTSGVPASEQDSGIETLTAAFVSAAQYVQQAKVHSVPEGEIRSQLDDFYEQVKRLGAYTRTNLQEERDRERRLLSEFKEDLMRRT
ncbi:MAG: hypothetical protein KDD70_19070, partial [Bdellovibrionales bacterium]|nr:hypothetical protein [Bdellovibrionales bacterium]